MENNISMTDVLVAGAGPTGLMLAIELATAGVRVTVIERLAEPDETIKAGAMGALAGEALERRGFGPTIDAEERAMVESMATMLKQTGNPANVPVNPLRKIGGHFAGLFLIDQTSQREPERRLRGVKQQALERMPVSYTHLDVYKRQGQREPERRLRGVKQQALERMLGERVRTMGIDVRRGHEIVDFRELADGIDVEVCGPQGIFTQRCAYLVGCDGGRSTVRKRAGFEFPGTEPTLTGHQAIVELDHPERLLPLGWRRTPAGMMAFGPIPGRIFVVEFDGPPEDRNAPITVEEVQKSLRNVSGADVMITAMKSATRFTDNARQATTYRLGRVLLAGDAAHVHSPFGGQGLNLGILDAVNLGWKLAAMVHGRAPVELLDTYTQERHPVAARVLANTRAQVALMRPDVLTTALREIVTEIMDLEEGNRFFGEMMSGITIRYPLGDSHPQVGRLCGDLRLTLDDGETTLFSLMSQGGGVLVDAADGTAERIARAWSPRIQTVRTQGGTSMFVRPDGCIAWADDDGRTEGLAASLEQWLGVREQASHA